MEKKNKKLPIIIGAVAVVIIAVIVVLVVVNKGHRVIEVKSFNGAVTLERGSSEKDIVKGMHLKSKDTVTTGEDGLVELLVDEDKHIVAEANTCFTITSSGNEKKGKLKIELLYGTSLIEIENKLPNGSSVEVETPNASLSVRGTTFETTYTEKNNTTVLKVTDGVVQVDSDKESKEVQAGQMAVVSDDGSIQVGDFVFMYEDTEAFELKYFYSGNPAGIYVKNLEGFICADDYEFDDLLNNDWNLRLRYSVLTESEKDHAINMCETDYVFEGREDIKNSDGDDVIIVSYSGLCGIFKEIKQDMYLRITISITTVDGTLNGVDPRCFLPLTTDEFYVYKIITDEEDAESIPSNDVNIETVPAGTPVAEDEWSSLLRGELEYTQLEYLLRVAQMCYQEGNEEYVTTALWDLWFVPSWDGVYEPINGTNDTYDVETLNNLLSFLTDEKISESNINSYCSLYGNEITYKPCDVTRGDSTSITIVKAEYGENNEIIVEYNFKELYGSDGMMGRNGVGIAHLVPDTNGKYKLDYIEEYSSEEFNYN